MEKMGISLPVGQRQELIAAILAAAIVQNRTLSAPDAATQVYWEVLEAIKHPAPR